MSKTIEEIKKEVELKHSFALVGSQTNIAIEIAERYAQSKTETIKHLAGVNSELKKKTQELQEQNAELVGMLTEIRNRIQCGKSLTKTNHMVMIDYLLTKLNQM